MAFLNKSIEDSLKLITTKETTPSDPPKRRGRPPKKAIPNVSPVRVPQMSPVNKFSPFRTTSRDTSPIPIQQSPVKEQVVVQSSPKAEAEPSPIPEPASPAKPTVDVIETLKTKYFNVIKFIEDEDSMLYVITYDPNGQIVFVELDIEDSVSSEGHNLLTTERQSFIDFPFSLKEYFKNRINDSIYGVVMTRGENMCFLTRTNTADVVENYYGSTTESNDKVNVYCVYRYSDLMEDLDTSLQSISFTYEAIQQHQLVTNKETFKNAMTEIEKISHYAKEFDKTYTNFTKHILEDWARFSNISVDYIDKLLDDGLSEDEASKFDMVSLNLYARFQAFNDITTIVDGLKTIPTTLLEVKTKLKEAIDKFETDNERMADKILDKSDVSISF